MFPSKIEVFSRHCLLSTISQHKKRTPGFSREACYANFLETINPSLANVTFLLDVARGDRDLHFLPKENTIEIKEGTESGSFLRLLDHVSKLPLHPDTILYFVEDDYIHRPGWVDILLEGFQVPNIDYVTLYDHRDKYFLPMYNGLTARLFATPSCHWRTAPSTTQTFATRFKTLLRDLPLHREYSTGREISADHEKFLHLQRRGATLISSIPGWSTHAEPEFASPCIAWETFLTPNLRPV